MKYSKELHDQLRKQDKESEDWRNPFSRLEVEIALLDEIDRLQAERRWIPFTEERPPADEKSYTAIMVNGKTYWTRLPEQPAPESEG